MNPARHLAVAATLIACLAGGGLVAPAAQAQQAAPEPVETVVQAPPVVPQIAPGTGANPAAETAALQRLSEYLRARRSELDGQRQARAQERARIVAIDQPASTEQLARWRERHEFSTRTGRRIEVLEGLIAALTPQALENLSAPREIRYEFVTTGPGLATTRLEVALRDAPEGAATILVPADTLVVELAADAGGLWSVVVAAGGTGFVPTSQLQRVD